MRFGEYLIMHGIITQEQLSHALDYQMQGGVLLGESLVFLGYASGETIDFYLQKHLLHQAENIVRNHRHNISSI